MDQPTPNTVPPPADLARWTAAPAEAFSQWLAQPTCSVSPKPLAASSKRIYATMWRKFTLWLEHSGLRLDEVKSRHIWVFLEEACSNKTRQSRPAPPLAELGQPGFQEEVPDVTEVTFTEQKIPLATSSVSSKRRTEHRQRYIRLIERTYDYLRDELGLNWANPGREAALYRMGAGKNAPTQFLSPKACENLFAAIQRFLESPIPTEINPDEIAWTRQWGAARDMALVGTLVGSGLRVEEVHRLTVNCTLRGNSDPDTAETYPDVLSVPASLLTPTRKALCLPTVRPCLAAWLQWRQTMPWGTQSGAIFPAATRLRRSPHLAKPEAMHPATLFRAVSRVLNQQGIVGARVGAQTLRNTYAALLLEAGCSDQTLMETLGLKTPMSVFRLREKLSPAEEESLNPFRQTYANLLIAEQIRR